MITLCALMRDEKNVIGRCVRSVVETLGDQLSGVVLADTGSTDSTIAVAKAALSELDCPWVVVEHEWVDFSTNRNRLLDVAELDAEWLLMLDPDMTIEGELPELAGDGYQLEILGIGQTSFWNPRLLSTSRPWRYAGVVHEALVDYPGLPKLDGLRIRHHGAPDHAADGRFNRDRALLASAIDTRSLFDLAQTERDLGNSERAADLYELRASLGGYPEEEYYALYQAGHIRQSIEGLLRAWEARPSRGEALYYLIGLMRGAAMWKTAHALSTIGVEIAEPTEDVLWVEPWVYQWGLRFEHSITSYWVGDFVTCAGISDELAVDPEVWPHVREQAARNAVMARDRVMV